MPKALAFSNNDIAVFAWTYEQKLKDCLGFAVFRGDVHAGVDLGAAAGARALRSHR